MPKTLNPVPNPAAVEIWYRRKLLALVKGMEQSVMYWVKAKYRRQESRIVGDASPGVTLWEELNSIFKANTSKFDEVAENIAKGVAGKTQKFVETNLFDQLRKSGFGLTPRIPRSVAARASALMRENALLIKSIPRQYMDSVGQAIQRGVLNGRNREHVMEAIMETGAVSERRAAMIARDQVHKGAQAIAQETCRSVGIIKGVWQHNVGGKTVRKEHADFEGQEFYLSQGLYDEKEDMLVLPGELINCRCSYKPVLPEAVDWQ